VTKVGKIPVKANCPETTKVNRKGTCEFRVLSKLHFSFPFAGK
jgi:hypothetical protein